MALLSAGRSFLEVAAVVEMKASINVDLLEDDELTDSLSLVRRLRADLAHSPYFLWQQGLFTLLEGVLLGEMNNRKRRSRQHEAATVSFDVFRKWPLDALEETWTLLANLYEKLTREGWSETQLELFARPENAISEERIARDQINRV